MAIRIFLTGRNDGDLWSDSTEEFRHFGILAALMAHLSECRQEEIPARFLPALHTPPASLRRRAKEWCAKGGMGISR
jgi:hypothetical protein